MSDLFEKPTLIDDDDFAVAGDPRVVTRTLIAAGYEITNFRRQHNHGEWVCEHLDVLGAKVRCLVAVFDSAEPIDTELRFAAKEALRAGRALVVVAQSPGEEWLSLAEFFERLGGAVPTWRALGTEYSTILAVSSANVTPVGFSREGWSVFEDAVADGLELIFGRRVRRLGGSRRGDRVSDMIAQTPDHNTLVVDAKASAADYDVGAPKLRPLVEYVRNQVTRQNGRVGVGGSIVVARSFAQEQARLAEIASDFLADTKVPLSFLEVDTLLHMIGRLSSEPQMRNTLRWARLFCTVGLVTIEAFDRELAASERESFPR